MSIDRRQFVVGSGTVLLGAVGIGTNALADEHDVQVYIGEVDTEADTVVLENRGGDDVDLTDYAIDWEYANDDATQEDGFPAGTTLEAGASLIVWSGFLATDRDSVEHDVIVGDEEPGNGRVHDNEENVIALIAPNGEAVVTSDGEVQPPEEGDGEDGDEEDGDGGEEEDEEDEETGSEEDDLEEDREEAVEDEEDGEAADEEEETADEGTDEDDC